MMIEREAKGGAGISVDRDWGTRQRWKLCLRNREMGAFWNGRWGTKLWGDFGFGFQRTKLMTYDFGFISFRFIACLVMHAQTCNVCLPRFLSTAWQITRHLVSFWLFCFPWLLHYFPPLFSFLLIEFKCQQQSRSIFASLHLASALKFVFLKQIITVVDKKH